MPFAAAATTKWRATEPSPLLRTRRRVYYTRARGFASGSEQYRRLSSKLVDMNEEG